MILSYPKKETNNTTKSATKVIGDVAEKFQGSSKFMKSVFGHFEMYIGA